MSDSIKLSPKHGFNAFIPVCFWCGKDKNEIAIPGRINRADDATPMRALADYEPCEKCEELFSKGIQVIGVTPDPIVKNMPPICKTEGSYRYPTGTCAVVTPEFIDEILLKPNGNHDDFDEIVSKGKVLVDQDVCMQVIDFIKEWRDDDVSEGDTAKETEEPDNENS